MIDKILPMDSEQTLGAVMSMCIKTIGKLTTNKDTDSSMEVQVRRANLLYSLLQKNPHVLSTFGFDLVSKLYTRLETFKEKKNVEDQNLDKMLSAFLRIVWLAYATRVEHHAQHLEGLHAKLEAIPRFRVLLNKIQA